MGRVDSLIAHFLRIPALGCSAIEENVQLRRSVAQLDSSYSQ